MMLLSNKHSNNHWQIRSACIKDAADICAIYAPYVEDTTISFETVAPTQNQMAQRLLDTLPKYPWIVFEVEGSVIGYAYASQHRTREAYRWSVDVAAYVHTKFMRQGIGRELYKKLLQELEILGYANAFAGIALPNDASIALHESFGFTTIGIYRKVGYKQGAWHDVGWWQKSFTHPSNPQDPLKPENKKATP